MTIAYEGPSHQLEPRFMKDGSTLNSEEVDVAYRLRDTLEHAEPEGVLALADRMTGEYVLEVNLAAGEIFAFVDAAREFAEEADSEGRYRINIRTEDGPLAGFDLSTLLVYDTEGELLRGKSLIPSGVQL